MRTEPDKYRETMALVALMQECLDRLKETSVFKEFVYSGRETTPASEITVALADIEKALVDLFAQQPPFHDEAIRSAGEIPGVTGPYEVIPKTPEDKIECSVRVYDVPFTVEGPAGTWTFKENEEHVAKLLALRLNKAHVVGAESRDNEVDCLEHKASSAAPSLRRDVAWLVQEMGKLGLYPLPDRDHPSGIGGCEAAAVVIGELKGKCDALEEKLKTAESARNNAAEMLVASRVDEPVHSDRVGSPRCCHLPCTKPAEWEIVSGPTVDDCTEACTEHVGKLLSDAREHYIHPIPRVDSKEETDG